MSERPTCRTCPHWNGFGEATVETWKELSCLRYPPTVIVKPDHEDPVCLRPLRYADDSCGEHPDSPAWIASLKAKQPATPAPPPPIPPPPRAISDYDTFIKLVRDLRDK